jgi:hypothetical protein
MIGSATAFHAPAAHLRRLERTYFTFFFVRSIPSTLDKASLLVKLDCL